MGKVKRIITRADDAGNSRSANRAIRESCLQGVCRNVSLMAPCAYIGDAADCLKDLTDVCFGLHGTFNSEWESPRWGPVLSSEEVSSLLDTDGAFTRHPKELHAMPIRIEEIIAELEAQLRKLQSLGFNVRYMDEHMGFGNHLGIRPELVEFARKHSLVYYPEVRSLSLEGDGVVQSRQLAERFIEQVQASSPGVYLVIGHPCYNDEEIRSIVDPNNPPGYHGPNREAQRILYTDPEVVALFDSEDIIAVRYDEVG